MTEEKKYYTPSVEEFHVGFEYEAAYAGNTSTSTSEPVALGEYESLVCREGNVLKLDPSISFRVKYLDREDIESLGWEFVPDNSVGDGDFRWYDLFQKGEFSIALSFETRGTNVIHKNRSVVFDGAIRNKSELQRVMKMLGIEK